MGCSNSRGTSPNLSFFGFPRNEARCRKWIVNCGREDLLKRSLSRLSRRRFLCSDHFEAAMFTNEHKRNRLVWNALPTRFHFPGRTKPSHAANGRIRKLVSAPKPVRRAANETDLVEYADIFNMLEVSLTEDEHHLTFTATSPRSDGQIGGHRSCRGPSGLDEAVPAESGLDPVKEEEVGDGAYPVSAWCSVGPQEVVRVQFERVPVMKEEPWSTTPERILSDPVTPSPGTAPGGEDGPFDATRAIQKERLHPEESAEKPSQPKAGGAYPLGSKGTLRRFNKTYCRSEPTSRQWAVKARKTHGESGDAFPPSFGHTLTLNEQDHSDDLCIKLELPPDPDTSFEEWQNLMTLRNEESKDAAHKRNVDENAAPLCRRLRTRRTHDQRHDGHPGHSEDDGRTKTHRRGPPGDRPQPPTATTTQRPPDKLQAYRRRKADARRRARAAETPDVREERQRKDAERHRLARQNMSEDELEAHRARRRQAHASAVAKASPEQRLTRKVRNATARARARRNESDEQRRKRREADAVRHAAAREHTDGRRPANDCYEMAAVVLAVLSD